MPDTEENTQEQDERTAETVVEHKPDLDLSAEVEKWKALARKNEARAKENADKAKRFDEFEESQKSELEKAQARAEAAGKALAERAEADQRAEAEKEAAEERKRIAEQVAKDTNVPADVVLALQGDTLEDLTAGAEKIKALTPDLPKLPSAEGQGKSGEPIGAGELSVDEIVHEATRR